MVLRKWKPRWHVSDDMVSRPTCQPTPPFAPRTTTPTCTRCCCPYCGCAMSWHSPLHRRRQSCAHVVPVLAACARHRLLLAHALLLSNSSGQRSSGQRTASEPAASFGGDDDWPGRSCRRMASTRQPLAHYHSCRLRCTLSKSHIIRSLYEDEDVRRTAHGFAPPASCCCYERLRRRFIIG